MTAFDSRNHEYQSTAGNVVLTASIEELLRMSRRSRLINHLQLVVPLEEDAAKLIELVGGKAASLAELRSLGLFSLNGFVVTTNAYHDHFLKLWSPTNPGRLATIPYGQAILTKEELSIVRVRIVNSELSPDLEDSLLDALIDLGKISREHPLRVAIRSSATIEDSPDASFAGQHESFLNIAQPNSIMEYIKKCWSSYWSDRAYFYRNNRGFNHWRGAMAVVVQEFFPAEASGTLFTANPVTGKKDQTVIEACWGLGELIVSGRVTPDTYYVDTGQPVPQITNKMVKTKRHMLLPAENGKEGLVEIEVPSARSSSQVLSNEDILELAQIGLQISKCYGRPQDIEWAINANQIAILQSRPITAFSQSTL